MVFIILLYNIFQEKMCTPRIENVYLNGPILTPYSMFRGGPKYLRQVSQITYYGPYGKRSIYIDYDEQWDNIFIYDDDKIYSVNAGNVLIINQGYTCIKIYDITIKEILENLIEGDFDIYVTWAENGLPHSVLHERVFQAPLSQIEAYWLPSMPSIPEEDESRVSPNEYTQSFDNCCADCDRKRESPYLNTEYEYFEYSANY